jgi:nucleoside phosphorylase
VEIAIRAVTGAELSSSKLEAVVSTGFCGALDPQLRECQIVVATKILDVGANTTFECGTVDADSPFTSGLLLSQDRVANNAAEKAQLRQHGALALDMEAAGVAARTTRAALPFYSIKVVCDRADESFPLDINTMRTPDGRIRRVKIGLHALTHPKVLRPLFHWKRRSGNAAKALGDFLVGCRIRPKSDTALAE